ncbi:MAG: alpha/beta fold hydrolase [Proteobacteria bacterium]|nr:alpha/beta fold hydrolase [Pseudomonadota bacterium]
MQRLPQDSKNTNDKNSFYNNYWLEHFFESVESNYKQTNTLLKELQNKLNELSIHDFDHMLNHISISLNPKYYPMTNKDVFKLTLETGGENLINGFSNLNEHIKKGKLPSLSDVQSFKLGENLATSRGNVIYRNDLMEIIHYTPIKKNKHKTPILIVPPWINKFYIFDLTDEKSFVQYNLKKGIDVFVISWKNPDENDKHLTLNYYVEHGIEEAIQFIDKKINLLGFCLGGVGTCIATLAHKKNLIESLTLLATPIDFTKLTELQNFIRPLNFKEYKKSILKKGYKCGKDLLRMFCLMRAENMIMDNIVHQYYLNKEPKPNPFLYWNMDATNLPARMHIDYLEKFFYKNQLYRGVYHYNGEKLSFKNLKIPIFVLMTEKDHIVPKESSLGLQKFNIDATYVLGGSGHIAGVINPPEQKKYHYQVLNQNNGTNIKKDFSWWDEWYKWLKPKLGEKIKMDNNFEPIDTAPGLYAMNQPALKDYLPSIS